MKNTNIEKLTCNIMIIVMVHNYTPRIQNKLYPSSDMQK